MTISSTTVTMTAIKTEFGGTTPINMSAYYRGGTNVPSGQTATPVDSTAIPTSGTIRMGEFRGQTKVSSGSVQAVTGFTSNTSAGTTGVRTATFKLVNDGTAQHNTGSSNTLVAYGNWYTPTTAGIGTSYWAFATITTAASGGTAGGTYNSWIQLTNGSSWTLASTSSTHDGTMTISIKIAASSGGATLATCSISFDAGYTP